MLRQWWVHLLLVSALAISVFGLLESYFNNNQASLERRSQALAREIAENLRDQVVDRSRVMQTLADSNLIDIEGSEGDYLRAAHALMKNYDGFYNVSFIDKSGVIKRVYPLERNRAALGHNLLQREDIAVYLRASRDQHTPMMSHALTTYQGTKGFVLFIPLYREGKFYGYLSGVMDLGGWFNKEVEARGQNLFVQLAWAHPDSEVFQTGTDPGGRSVLLPFRIWNQDLGLRVGLMHSNSLSPAVLFHRGLFAAAVALTLMAGYLVIQSRRSLLRVKALNRRLRIKNALVSSLAHDMSTPLTVLGIGLEKLKKTPGAASWARVERSYGNLRRMLDSARSLHAMETGSIKIQPEKIDLISAVDAAVENVRELAESKNIEIRNEVPADLPAVLAERATLEQNVLPNILINSIKFSSKGTKIIISAFPHGKGLRLTVRDFGMGLPASRETASEGGTGLGTVQAQIFMEIYGGSFELASENDGEEGTTASLTFQAAET